MSQGNIQLDRFVVAPKIAVSNEPVVNFRRLSCSCSSLQGTGLGSAFSRFINGLEAEPNSREMFKLSHSNRNKIPDVTLVSGHFRFALRHLLEYLESSVPNSYFLKLWVATPDVGRDLIGNCQVINTYLKFCYIDAQFWQISKLLRFKLILKKIIAAAGETFSDYFS
jgi:hypothetical protein